MPTLLHPGAGRAVPALVRTLLVQPALWQGRGCLGTKSRSERLGWGHSGYVAASEDGYQMVPQVDLPPGRDPVSAGKVEVRRGKEQRTVPFYGVHMGELTKWMTSN